MKNCVLEEVNVRAKMESRGVNVTLTGQENTVLVVYGRRIVFPHILIHCALEIQNFLMVKEIKKKSEL